MSIIEVKFGDIDKTFPGINRFSFNRLLNYFHFNKKTLTTIYFSNNVKKIIDDQLVVTYKDKRCIDYQYDFNYNLHYFYCKEQTIEEPESFSTNYNKEKLKYNYQFNKDIELELSETTIKNENEIVNAYEVELKCYNNHPLLDIIVKKLVKLLQSSDILYTSLTLKNLNDDINCYQLSKTKNVDLSTFKVDQLYVVSTKAKGERCMLVIHYTGVWLITKHRFNLMIDTNTEYFNYFINSFNTSIFDGELIVPLHKNRYEFNYQYWFLCYDCLKFNKSDIRHFNYGERIDYAKTLKRLITWYVEPSLLQIDLKTTRQFSNEEEKNKALTYLFNLSPILNYQHNGLIITPVLQPYTCAYKWVYPDKMTIDFAIYPNGKEVKLYLYNQDVQNDIAFKGTPLLPFDESMILQSSFVASDKKRIGECRWDQVLNKMVLVKIRSDKEDADPIDLAIENWEHMLHPLVNDCCL